MLRIAEFTSLVLLVMNAGAFLWATRSKAAAEFLQAPLLAGFALLFLHVLLIVAHATPLARARRPRHSPIDEGDSLSTGDFKTILRLAPLGHRVVGALGLVALVAAFVGIGGVAWNSGSPFEQHHARGIALYSAGLCAVLYPVLAAFARLPPSMEMRLALLRRDDP